MKDFSIPIKEDSKLPLAGFTPIVWNMEFVRGCNLRCGFCATTRFPRGEFLYMSEQTLIDSVKIISEISPQTRIEIALAGEHTLHPDFIKLIEITREYLPKSQIGVVTNGTTLLSGAITYKQMFDAGLNIALVDVYGPIENHIKIAKESGYEWYEKAKPHRDKLPKAWTNNQNPVINCIIFQPNPAEWPKRKSRKTMLTTYLNEVDFELGKQYGMEPVTKAPYRKCDQTPKQVNICWDGEYIFCCMDFMRASVKRNLGNVSSGTRGFINFWLGEYMQTTRQILHRKNRPAHEFCSKCGYCSSRGDIDFWPEESLNQYIKDGEWFPLESGVEEIKNRWGR
jgi:organic radical activating enzyme